MSTLPKRFGFYSGEQVLLGFFRMVRAIYDYFDLRKAVTLSEVVLYVRFRPTPFSPTLNYMAEF